MLFAYLIALLPAVAGAIQWVTSHKVVWWEWLAGSALGFALAGGFHVVLINSMGKDVETWSGRVTHAIHHPWWRAEWTELETYQTTNHKGETETHTRLVTKTRNYPEYWTAEVSYGSRAYSYEISQAEFRQVCRRFGVDKPRAVEGRRPDFDDGDRNDYWADNRTNEVIPANTTYEWENRVKAAPSAFSFPKVPEDSGVFEYPRSADWRRSSRLLGAAKSDFTIHAWDCMNADLGPSVRVNVIAVGFGPDSSSEMGAYQEARWIGGKKNDLVVCYGGVGRDGRPGWTYAFGWTEQEIVKRNLETLFILNRPSDDLIPKIRAEIQGNYVIKDWSKFDYLTVEPPWWAFVVLITVMGAAQGGFWYYARTNPENKTYEVY